MQTHSIRRLITEVQIRHSKDTASSQQRLSYWINTPGFRRQMEDTLNELVSEDEYLQIDRLELHISGKNEQEFRTSFFANLKKSVRELQGQPSAIKQINFNQATQNMALYFLAHGIMPWSANHHTAERVRLFIQNIPGHQDDVFVEKLFEAARYRPEIWRRLIFCTGTAVVKAVVARRVNFSPGFTEWLEQVESSPTTLRGKQEKIRLWQSVLQLISEGKDESFIRKHIGSEPDSRPSEGDACRALPEAGPVSSDNPKVGMQSALANAKPFDKVMEEGCFVRDAGLILIWRNAGQLFRRLGYIDGKAFRNTESQQRAIVLLQYLATGEWQVWEDELLLNKVLCGWPVEQPVDTTLLPDEQARNAGDEILQTFVDQWMKGRCYSPQWVRQHFFRRTGMLRQRPDQHWHLTVERKTEDILLDTLPPGVGISVVKYAWMDNIIFVQW